MGEPLHMARQSCQIGERLVVQVHADAVALDFQRFRQFKRAEAQAFLPRSRFRFHNGGPLGLLRRTDREEIRGKQIGNRLGIFHVPHGVAGGSETGTAERADNIALRL